MADPKSWLAVLALESQLAVITVANGYLTDLGKNVWTEPAQRNEKVAQGVSIFARTLDRWPGERPNKRGRVEMLTVEAAISTDLDNAHQLAHQMVEDIENAMAAAIALNPATLDGVPGAKPFDIESIEIQPHPEGLPIIAVAIVVSAGYLR